MSFVQGGNNLLIKDLWPEPLASVVYSRGQEQLEEWQIVPIAFADVCAWAYIAKKHQTYDHTRIYHLLYKSPIGEINTVYPVVIRIQGILGRFELAPLGTWNGSKDSVASAIQFVTLLSGGHDELWQSTHESVRIIRQLVHNSLEGSNPFIEPAANGNKNVYLQHRIFSKVHPQLMDKPSVLSEGDDPHGWISAIADKWGVVEQLQIGRRLVEGQAVSCSPYALSRGDFVDVGMGFDICTSRTPTGRMRNNVNLSMIHVLQLLPACMISKIDANPVDNFNSTEMVPVPTPVVHNSGLIFQPMEEPKVDENMETEVQI